MNFSRELASHPDQEKISYNIESLHHGFKLGFQASHRLRPAKKNKLSAFQHQKVADEYLANEVSPGTVACPFISPPLPRLHISSFEVIPKWGQPGKWHLIFDLSSPGGCSVNDGIEPQDFNLQYITADQIIQMTTQYDPGDLMAKCDVEVAYWKHCCPFWRLLFARNDMAGSVLYTCRPHTPLWSLLCTFYR